MARFVSPPRAVPAGTRVPLSGVVQVGTAGLRGVQYWVARGEPEASDDNRHFHREDWRNAEVLPLAEDWAPQGETSAGVRGFGPDGAPRRWPLYYTTAHWAALTPPLQSGRYTLYCRSLDRQGRPQPWPRTLQNDGRNLLHHVPLHVHG